jgi:hypothetical protein
MDTLGSLPNPFRHAIVTDPWQSPGVDVPEIHARAFAACCKALESVREEARSISVLLHGEAGSGKTHLLARLRRHWTGHPSPGLDPIQPEVVFIAVRLQTGPQRLWRYLRRSVAEDLLRTSDDGVTQLERILLRRFAEIRPADADLLLWWAWLGQQYPNPVDLEQVLDDLLERLDPDGGLGRDLCKVLVHLLLKRRRRDARAWLRGDPLPESALSALSLGGAEDDGDQEDQARQVVVALCRLAGPKIPVVFCFDQIEALQIEPRDDAALFAFGQLVMALFQETRNALLITCVQSAYLDHLKRSVCVGSEPAIRDAAWARLAVHQASLNPLRWEEAVLLVGARMEGLPELAAARPEHAEPLWPLEEGRLRTEVGHGDTARRILSLSAELFDAAARRPAVPREPAEHFLERTWQERLERCVAANRPEQADAILVHGLPLLVHALGRPWSPSDAHLRDIDVLLEGSDGRVGISLCNHRDLRGLWRRLRRLPDHLRHRKLEKLVLVRDARLPIGQQAVKVHRYLDELRNQGAQWVRPSAEALAALDALRGLLSDAKAGDLANKGETVTPQTVQQWLAAHLPAALRDLLEEVVSYPGVGGSVSVQDVFDRLMERLDERPVMTLEDAAAGLGIPLIELGSCVLNQAQHVGYLEGPPAVVFRLVATEVEPAGSEDDAEAVLPGP